MRIAAIILLMIVFHTGGQAQDRSSVWIFGRGLGMDFNTDPVSFFNVPWQPQGYNDSGLNDNVPTVLSDEDGNLILYFLNGRYYDSTYTEIPQGVPSVYISTAPYLLPARLSGFLQRPGSDTVYHYYYYYTDNHFFQQLYQIDLQRIRLNRILRVNGVLQIDSLDTFFAFGNPVQGNNLLYYVQDTYPIEIGSELILAAASSAYGPIYFLRVGANGFSAPRHIALPPGLPPATGGFSSAAFVYHPLLELLYMPYHNPSQGLHAGLAVYRYNGTGFVYEKSLPTVSPSRFGTSEYYRLLTSMAISQSGRYLFAITYPEEANSAYHYKKGILMRYDLLASDSAAFAQSAVEIDVLHPDPFFGQQQLLTQVMSAPDGAVYLLWTEFLWQLGSVGYVISPNSRHIGRIGHPDSSLAKMSYTPVYHTFPEYSVGLYFPTFSSAQSLPPPFELLSQCSDSVQFDLTYKAMVDSVWWDFGDPASGASNYSTQLDPMHKYSGYGRYYATVELWLRGELLKTVGDSISVERVPEVQLPPDQLLCFDDTLHLDVRQGFNADYRWSTGSTDSLLAITESGLYTVNVSTNCGSYRDTIEVEFIDALNLDLPDTLVLCSSEDGEINLPFHPYARYQWSTGSTESRLVIVDSGSYWLRANTPCEGYYKDFRAEERNCTGEIYVPSAFSPNGDRVNDRFIVGGLQGDFKLEVFNRWGEQVYMQPAYAQNWNGSMSNGAALPQGVYIWRIVQGDREYKGTVLVIR